VRVQMYHRDASVVALHNFFRSFLQQLLRVEPILWSRVHAGDVGEIDGKKRKVEERNLKSRHPRAIENLMVEA